MMPLRLPSWLVAVAAVILTSGATASFAADAAVPEPVTFVIYNLKNYLGMDRRVKGELKENAGKPEDEIVPLIAAIAATKPDLLGVCELGDKTHLDDLKSRLKEVGIDLPHTELVRAASGYDRNLALLSRFPIVARNSRDDLSYDIGKTRLPFQRGILDATVAVNEDYQLRLVGLHLKSKREVPEADQAEMRRNEAHLARQHIDGIFASDPDANLIVYGDLNDYPYEPPVKAVRGRYRSPGYLSDLKPADRFGFRWTHHWSYQDIYARIDYALVSDGISKEIDRDRCHIFHPTDWDKASDHRPLVIFVKPMDVVKNK